MVTRNTWQWKGWRMGSTTDCGLWLLIITSVQEWSFSSGRKRNNLKNKKMCCVLRNIWARRKTALVFRKTHHCVKWKWGWGEDNYMGQTQSTGSSCALSSDPHSNPGGRCYWSHFTKIRSFYNLVSASHVPRAALKSWHGLSHLSLTTSWLSECQSSPFLQRQKLRCRMLMSLI